MELVEEFAPDSNSEEFQKVINPPMIKQFISYSNKDEIKNNLLKENLKQIIENDESSDDDNESNKLRYFKLDFANTQLEIMELKEKYEILEKKNKLLDTIELIFHQLDTNIETYNELIDNKNKLSYRDIIKKEIETVKNTTFPIQDFDLLLPSKIACSIMLTYENKRIKQIQLSNKLQKKLNQDKNSIYNNLQYILLFLLFIQLIIVYFRG